MRIYCQKCGQPTEYSGASAKPKFCSHCATGFGETTYTLSANKSVPKHKSKAGFELDIGPQVTPGLSRLEVDIDVEKPHGIKMSDLAGTGSDVNNEEAMTNLPLPEMSTEEFLKSFKEEAGAIREKKRKDG